jgi:Kiwa protein KwaB-like
MTAEELRALIIASGAKAELAVGVAWFEANNYRVARAALDAELQKDFRDVARRAAGRLHRRTSQDYQLGDDLARDHVGVLPSANASGELIHPKAADALNDLRKSADVDPLTADDLEEVPSFYALIWRDAATSKVVLLGRRLSRQSVARRRGGFSARLAGDEATLRRFEGKLIMFDDDVDWLLVEGTFFVFKPRPFEDSFLDATALVAAVGKNAETLHQKVPIKNLREFQKRCEELPSMQLKLARIVGRDGFPSWSPDLTKLETYSEKYGDKTGPVVQFAGNQMVFEGSFKKQWNILKLLDEAFFTSELTSTKFEATGKHTVG